MVWLKYIITFLLFFLMTLIQFSFLPFFSIGGVVPNLVFILFFTVVFFNKDLIFVLSSAVLAGLFLAMYQPIDFLAAIAALLLTLAFIKTALYFLREEQSDYFIAYYLGLFLFSFLLYNTILKMLGYPAFASHFFIAMFYNAILAYFAFHIYSLVDKLLSPSKQLSLFDR